ncbi:hypothetical protein [Flavobacterium yafengii]|uniref:hypothetical protein n=1 Tax=Flavobacterium yafengii TaxID=3041253 RepID=UPI0024A93D83|nr:hypothetical protein [Flavobacterium yafengii]MDI5898636.1 hypothetical protein [Flavobacterium yafengii]
MFSRINFIKIIKAHLKTLRSLNQTSNLIYWNDFLLFYLIPIFLSILLIYFNISIKTQVSNLIAAISILGGFLFNLLAIIYNSMGNLKSDALKNEIKKKYVKEIHSNISYNILVSIFLIILLIIFNIDIKFNDLSITKGINISIEFCTTFLLSHFFLTLLMVLNRIYILLDKE